VVYEEGKCSVFILIFEFSLLLADRSLGSWCFMRIADFEIFISIF
jgi:hypothetical protein